LLTLNLVNSNTHFSSKKELQKASGKKNHGSLIIDSRSVPKGVPFDVNIGLISSDNLQMLYNMLNIHFLIPGVTTRRPQQVLLYTAENPWIYAILSY
jgi:hypothetical protein